MGVPLSLSPPYGVCCHVFSLRFYLVKPTCLSLFIMYGLGYTISNKNFGLYDIFVDFVRN